jgi:hypothetical protein
MDVFSCSTGRFGIAAYLSAAAIPKQAKPTRARMRRRIPVSGMRAI